MTNGNVSIIDDGVSAVAIRSSSIVAVSQRGLTVYVHLTGSRVPLEIGCDSVAAARGRAESLLSGMIGKDVVLKGDTV